MPRDLTSTMTRTADECAELEYLLVGDLRELLDEEADDINRRWLLAVLDVLVDIGHRELSLHEEEGGYLSEVLLEFPCWGREVGGLRDKKAREAQCIRRIRDHIAIHHSFQEIAESVRADLHEWVRRWMTHRLQEIHLIQTACNWVPGGPG